MYDDGVYFVCTYNRDPKNVTDALVRATCAVDPKTQYIVGADAKFGMLPLLCMPTPLVEKIVSYVLLSRLVPARVKKEKSELGLEEKKNKMDQVEQAAAKFVLQAVIPPEEDRKLGAAAATTASFVVGPTAAQP